MLGPFLSYFIFKMAGKMAKMAKGQMAGEQVVIRVH